MIVAPGGGYTLLSIDKEGSDVAKRFNEDGIDAFVLKYRVPARPENASLPKWFAPLQDAQRAVGIVRSNANAMGINASRIGFNGFSAGGHLTAHISTAWRERIYERIDEHDDASCRPDFSVLVYPWYIIDGNIKSSSKMASEIVIDGSTPLHISLRIKTIQLRRSKILHSTTFTLPPLG